MNTFNIQKFIKLCLPTSMNLTPKPNSGQELINNYQNRKYIENNSRSTEA